VNRYRWRGILVEPLPDCFARLQANYRGDPKLIFENLAISGKEEIRPFYRIKQGLDYLPEWCRGLGTFNQDVLLTHRWALPDIERYVECVQVPCISLGALLEKHGVKAIDLLQIDTEGYDYEIIKQIDFVRFKPALVSFEHEYIPPRDWEICKGLLKGQGYSMTHHLGNTLAYLPEM
jgi:FkbM family methyltransferase